MGYHASKIIELLHIFQLSLANHDDRRVALLKKYWLVEDYHIFLAEFKAKVQSSFCETRCYSLQSWLTMSNKSGIVCKQ